MGQVNITLTVDTELLKSLSTAPGNNTGQPPLDNNTWCTISQVGGKTDPHDLSQLTDPSDLISYVDVGDDVTFYGHALPVEGALQPIINITQIDLLDVPVDAFHMHAVHIPDQNDGPSGSTIKMTANNYFKTGIQPGNYNIHFSISYKCRILDPKIKVVPPLK
jgi:hypothetical protein